MTEFNLQNLTKAIESIQAFADGLEKQRDRNKRSRRHESNGYYPSEAYAYTPEKDTPDSWQVRIWENTEGTVTRAQLGRATAELSPGGLGGKRANIPASELSSVKLKMREAYRSIGIMADSMPHWIKENGQMPQRFKSQTITPLSEGAFDPIKGEVTITVIKPGFNVSKSRFYPAEMLKRDFGVFNGVKMFEDHPSFMDQLERPERSNRDWVGQLKPGEIWVEDDGTVKAKAIVIDENLKQKFVNLTKNNMLSQAAISIIALGEGVKDKVDGIKTFVVEKLTKGLSVDFVTYAGAGGKVEAMESDAPEDDIDLIDEDGFRRRRPDLVSIIEGTNKQATRKEDDDMSELDDVKKEIATVKADLAKATEATTSVTKERDALQKKLDEAQQAEAKEVAQKAISEKLSNAKLPEQSIERLKDRFKEADKPDGIEDAIESERKYVAALTGKGDVKNLGEGDPGEGEQSNAKAIESMTDSYVRQGLTKDAAKERAERFVRGR